MRLFAIAILSFMISSCSLYKPLEFKGMEDYSFSEQDGCNPICVELSFFNPNPYNIVLKSCLALQNHELLLVCVCLFMF